jgi:hypothetical protein
MEDIRNQACGGAWRRRATLAQATRLSCSVRVPQTKSDGSHWLASPQLPRTELHDISHLLQLPKDASSSVLSSFLHLLNKIIPLHDGATTCQASWQLHNLMAKCRPTTVKGFIRCRLRGRMTAIVHLLTRKTPAECDSARRCPGLHTPTFSVYCNSFGFSSVKRLIG